MYLPKLVFKLGNMCNVFFPKVIDTIEFHLTFLQPNKMYFNLMQSMVL